jgi:FkbM family methyltransferase
MLKLLLRVRSFLFFRVIRKISIKRSFKRLHLFVLARPWAQSINDFFLNIALNGRGYGNCCDLKSTGEASFLRALAKDNPILCIDVGANSGSYSRYILRYTNSDVIAFEPLPRAFEKLSILQSEYPGRLDPRNLGVGDLEESLEFFYGTSNSELGSFSSEVNAIDYVGLSNVNSIEAKTITLDSITESIKRKYARVDLLKIDTEGYEHNVLIGAKRFINELKPSYIQVEFNWHQLFVGHTLKSIADLLPDYSVHQLLPFGGGMIERNPDLPESNIFRYSNFVFKRET